jgi:hypothetical protein
MAPRVLPSRLELKSPAGSSSETPLGEGHLHSALISLAGADDAGMGPYRDPSPLPLLDDFRISLLDERPDPRQRLAPPISELLDALIDQMSRRFPATSLGRFIDHSHPYSPAPQLLRHLLAYGSANKYNPVSNSKMSGSNANRPIHKADSCRPKAMRLTMTATVKAID